MADCTVTEGSVTVGDAIETALIEGNWVYGCAEKCRQLAGNEVIRSPNLYQ